MENTTTIRTLDGKVSQIKNTPPVEITRTFRAAVELLWNAWSVPELAKQWWGPETYTCPEAKIDFREGGKYLLAMKSPEGVVIWSTGEYVEISLFKKIVCTDSFSDKDGNVVSAKSVGVPGDWGDVCSMRVEFESKGDDETVMRITHLGIPAEMHDDCVGGWNTSIDKLQRLVEKQS